jgi:chromosome segregation ATPase
MVHGFRISERLIDLEQTTQEHAGKINNLIPYKQVVTKLVGKYAALKRLPVAERAIEAAESAIEAAKSAINGLSVNTTIIYDMIADLKQKNAILTEQNTGLECTVTKLEAEQKAKNAILKEQNTGLECTVIRLEAEQRAMADTIKQIQANVAELETGKRKRLEDGNASLEDDKRQRS